MQKTIKEKISFEGIGLFSGKNVNVNLLPSKANTGIRFVRTDLPDKPSIKVSPRNAHYKMRRSILSENDVSIETVEHFLSALNAFGIDNIVIEVNAAELPLFDGSSLKYTEILNNIGLIDLGEAKKTIDIKTPISIKYEDASLVAIPSDKPGLSISYTLKYESPINITQYIDFVLNKENYISQIAPARTFCFRKEAEKFLESGFAKGGNIKNTLVINDDFTPVDNEFRFDNELSRHKVLDLLGDLSLLSYNINGHIIGIKSGHNENIKLVNALNKDIVMKGSYDKRETFLDAREILNILPHRYPFLLIDKVIELDSYKRAVGIKNVTFNEPFFQGHFPDQPIMPGVLQIEAMAQLGGALLMRKAENAKKIAVLLSMDNVKLRKTVVPGDQLRIIAETLRIKSRTGHLHTKAMVDDAIAAEADMKFMLLDPE